MSAQSIAGRSRCRTVRAPNLWGPQRRDDTSRRGPRKDLSIGWRDDMLDYVLQQEAQRASVIESRPARIQYATPPWVRPVTPQCVAEEANRQSLELVKLLSVMKTEGGHLGEYSRNSNGSYDIGPMQVNTVHLPELSRIYSIPQATVSKLLAYNGCFNVAIGAWLLRKRTNEAAGNFWYGIGRYHSTARADSNRYILRVHGVMVRLVNSEKRAVPPVQAAERASASADKVAAN